MQRYVVFQDIQSVFSNKLHFNMIPTDIERIYLIWRTRPQPADSSQDRRKEDWPELTGAAASGGVSSVRLGEGGAA